MLINYNQDKETDEQLNNLNILMQRFLDKCIYDESVVAKLKGDGIDRLTSVREITNQVNPIFVNSRWVLAYVSTVLQFYVEHRYQTLLQFASLVQVTLPDMAELLATAETT